MATFAANLPNFQRVNKSALFFAFHLHLFGALVVLQNVSDALFFSTIGVQSLPMVRFILAGVMLPLTLVYERISARDEKSRAFSPMLLLSGLLVLVLTVVRSFHEAGSVYALMVASPVLQAFLLAEFWTFASRYFTLGESKRAFPLLFAAASLGGIIAGLVTSTLASSLGSQGLLLLWLLLHWACLGYVFLVRRHLRELPDPRRESAPVQRLASRRSLWRRLWDALSAQPLATGIIALSFLGAVALFLAEYAYYDIFVRAYPDTNELTEFIGFWSAISSALNFALAFFLLPRITAQLGVRNVTLIQPLLAIVVFVAALSMPVLLVGVFSYLAIQSRNAIEESNEKLLYKGLSNELGQLVRARSEGAGKPLAAALAASLLYVFGDPESVLLGLFGLLGSVEFVSAAGIVVGLAYFGVAFYTRVAYPKAIVERIRTRSFDVSADEQSPGLESDESRNLLEQQIESEDTELVRFAADYLHGLDAKRAVELLAHRLRRADSELAAELLELLSHWGCGDYPEMDALLEEHLHHEQARVRAAAIALAASLDDPPIAAVLSGLEDPSADVRREAIAALCTHWDLMLVARGAEALGALHESEASSERIAGGAILARLTDRRNFRLLTP
ncbi:MAG: hypothetical protein RBU37_23765, partial [Myxococcota bacterium]|nr:hypothetical protein [Myxococcota bacterium]